MENINKTKTSSQILSDTADFLEQSDRWQKGTFFKANESNPEKGCSMCAHGVIMYCSSDLVKQEADNNVAAAAEAAGDGGAASSARDVAAGTIYKNLASREGISVQEYLRKHYGEVVVAHYKANMVGLKYEYNDDHNTTKQDVISKLREAALL